MHLKRLGQLHNSRAQPRSSALLQQLHRWALGPCASLESRTQHLPCQHRAVLRCYDRPAGPLLPHRSCRQPSQETPARQGRRAPCRQVASYHLPSTPLVRVLFRNHVIASALSPPLSLPVPSTLSAHYHLSLKTLFFASCLPSPLSPRMHLPSAPPSPLLACPHSSLHSVLCITKMSGTSFRAQGCCTAAPSPP